MPGPAASTAQAVPRAGYGETRLNPVGLSLAVAVHVGMLALLLTFKSPAFLETREPPLVVHSMKLEPPPPPASPPKPAKAVPPPAAAVFAPRTRLELPILDPPAILTSPEPLPVPQPAVHAPQPEPAAPPAPPSQPVSAGDLSSSMTHAPPPRYPHESRRKREQGTVLLAVLLSTDGTVIDVRVARSSGHARLDEAARSAVRRWRWSPTIRGGTAVQIRGTVEIPFVLTG